jgi:hypothetical protein
MKRSRFLGAILICLTAAVPVIAFFDPPSDPDELELNRRRLEKWRADPEHYQRLQRDLKAFWELPAEKRNQLRQLDRSLHEADSYTQKRLWAVLERYSNWLEHLSAPQRKQIEDADRGDRLRLIKELREQQWVEKLPAVVRKELEGLAKEKRSARITALLKEEKERRLAWQKELRNKLPRSIERPTRLVEFTPEVQSYVKDVLRPMLSTEERSLIEQAEGGDWPQLARVLLELSEKHPVTLPWIPGQRPTKYAELHAELRSAMPHQPLEPRYKRRLQAVVGKWPDFAIEFTKIAREKKIELPRQLGPSRPAEFKPALDRWLKDTLLPKLTKEEKEALRRAEGQWPEYPRKLKELAHKHELAIPGQSLPGPKEFWDKARTALPEVPDHVLRDFVLMELSQEERDELLKPGDDPQADRDRLREAYFKKKPEMLQKQRQIDSRALSHPPNKPHER